MTAPAPSPLPRTMSGVLLTGHGGFEVLQYREDLPIPIPRDGEVLVKVAASAINNTDINTRSGWYDKSVTQATSVGGAQGFKRTRQKAELEPPSSQPWSQNRSWSGEKLTFPFIQGADGCGEIVALGANVPTERLGERVLLKAMQQAGERQCRCLGSELDGTFAQYVRLEARDAYRVESRLSDAELAAIPCAYSTAEGMLSRASLTTGERVLITGASGGVGFSAVQLARLRGAEVVALVGKAKQKIVEEGGAHRTIERGSNLLEALGKESVDVVVDLVGGGGWAELLEVLCRGGRYVVSGAIAGPIVSLDLRTLYLKDLSFFGSTYQSAEVFPRLMAHIARDELSPIVAKQFPLSQIVEAQKTFLAKNFVGKIVLLP